MDKASHDGVQHKGQNLEGKQEIRVTHCSPKSKIALLFFFLLCLMGKYWLERKKAIVSGATGVCCCATTSQCIRCSNMWGALHHFLSHWVQYCSAGSETDVLLSVTCRWRLGTRQVIPKPTSSKLVKTNARVALLIFWICLSRFFGWVGSLKEKPRVNYADAMQH